MTQSGSRLPDSPPTGPTGKKTRHTIARADGAPLFIAGLWTEHAYEGKHTQSYAMVMDLLRLAPTTATLWPGDQGRVRHTAAKSGNGIAAVLTPLGLIG